MQSQQVQALCKIRDIYREIAQFELQFQKEYDLCLNEGMLLCSLSINDRDKYTSSEIAKLLGLTNSNASKVIRQVESKGLIKRILGDVDKRQMYFSLTEKGIKKINIIKCAEMEIPSLLGTIL